MSKKKKSLTGEERRKLDETAKKLNASWRKQTTEILKFATECLEARNNHPGTKSELAMRLEFGLKVFDKLCDIAETKVFYEPEIVPALPPHYSSIWELKRMDPEKLRDAVKFNVINPKLTRIDVLKIIPRTPSGRAQTTKLKIKVDWSIPEYQKPDFKKWLIGGQDQFPGIQVNWDDLAALENKTGVASGSTLQLPGSIEPAEKPTPEAAPIPVFASEDPADQAPDPAVTLVPQDAIDQQQLDERAPPPDPIADTAASDPVSPKDDLVETAAGLQPRALMEEIENVMKEIGF